MSISRLESLDDPRAAFFRDLKGQHPRLTQSGLILVEGEEQLRRAIDRDVRIQTLFCEEEFWEQFAPKLSGENAIQVLLAQREVLAQIVGYRLHRGIMALAERPADVSVRAIEFPALALNEVTDPENVGNIARSAAAFGFKTLIFDSKSSDPYSRRAIRVSMGGIFGVKVCGVECIQQLKSEDLQLFAVECGSSWPESWPDPERCVFVVGNEKRGVDPSLLAQCNGVISIPMDDSLLSSLNVATAAGIVCAEMFRRQTP